ncbi:MAG: hypothetical protein IJ681_08465 [Bacteroidales bacterium]|nr:hypothetical protein [Bacteroidales bacterium]
MKYGRIIVFLYIVAGYSLCSYAQNDIKTELKDFDFVVYETEHNYSGFDFKINKNNIKEYKALKKKLRKQVKNSERSGVEVSAELVGFFNDYHFSLGNNEIHSSVYMTKPHANYKDKMKEYNPQFVFGKVTDKTFFVRMPHYDYQDSVLSFANKAVEEFKKSGCDNIIIDERGNPGGSDRMFHPFVYLIADHKGSFYSYKWLNTKDNRNFIDTSWRDNYGELAERLVSQMDATDDKYIVLDNDSLYVIDSINTDAKPFKAAVIIDGCVASSGEFLIVFLRACSNRFKVYGQEPTLGCLDFANAKRMRLPSRRAGINIPVSCPIFDNFIDDTGITPDVRIPLPLPDTLTDNIDSWLKWVARDMENNTTDR